MHEKSVGITNTLARPSCFTSPISFRCSAKWITAVVNFLSKVSKYRSYLLFFLREKKSSQLIWQTHSGELINLSLRAVFNYSVKWSVNGQSEIYYIILYVSECSVPEPTIPGLQWPRSYRIIDIWNCIRRHKQDLISSCLLTYHCAV